MEAPDFWNDPEVSQNKMKEVKSLKDDVATYAALSAQYDDIETMIEMGYEENDPELIPEIDQMMKEFVQTYEDIRMKTLLSGEYDRNNAIVSLHAGAGGTESCDWAAMLYRMYTRWADKKGFSVEVLDSLDGEEAGIKSITFQVNGENAYGYLKSEKGVHRLVRISPFNAAGKRQTSFVSCDVMPDIEEDVDVEIREEDILKHEELTILAKSKEAGGFLVINQDGSQIFVMGHPEYDRMTLDSEYKRDREKGLAITLPCNYYPDDDPTQRPMLQWRSHGNILYANWLNYYVYQQTPYEFINTDEIIGK